MLTSSSFASIKKILSLYKTAKEDGKSIAGASIIKIILGVLFEGFLNSILSVSGLKSEGRCPFFINEVSVILDKSL